VLFRSRERERRRMDSMRLLEKRQREEAENLAQERERLKIERERLEREKIETERIRIYHERLEQERIQREYMEKKRMDEYRIREVDTMRRDKRGYGDRRSPGARRSPRDTYYHDDNSRNAARYAHEASPIRYADRDHHRDRSNMNRAEAPKTSSGYVQRKVDHYSDRRGSPADRMRSAEHGSKARYDGGMVMAQQHQIGGMNRRINDDGMNQSGSSRDQPSASQVRPSGPSTIDKRMLNASMGSVSSGMRGAVDNSNRQQRGRSPERQDSYTDRSKQQDHRNVVVSSTRMERDNVPRGDTNIASNTSLNNHNREKWVTPPRHSQHSMWPANDAKTRTNDQFNALPRTNPIQNLQLSTAAFISPLLAQFTATSQASNLGLLGVGPIRQPEVRYDNYYSVPQPNQNQNARRYN